MEMSAKDGTNSKEVLVELARYVINETIYIRDTNDFEIFTDNCLLTFYLILETCNAMKT